MKNSPHIRHPDIVTAKVRWTIALCSALLLSVCAAKDDPAFADRFASAELKYREGQFEAAAAQWSQLAKDKRVAGDNRLRALIGVTAVCQKMGLHQQAEAALTDAKPLLAKGAPSLVAAYYQQAGNLRMSMHRYEASLAAFAEALAYGRRVDNPELLASIYNEYGNVLYASGFTSDALESYRRSLATARERSMTTLTLNTLVNIARLQLKSDETVAALEALAEADGLLVAQSASYDGSIALFAIRDIERALADRQAVDDVQVHLEQIRRAQVFAIETNNSRLASLAYGYEGLDLRAAGDAAAEPLFRKAAFYAAASQAPDLLYRWQWQLAVALRRAGKSEEAIDAFTAAIGTLTPIRQELLSGYHNSYEFFQRNIRPLYMDLVDALLARADQDIDRAAQKAALDRARAVLETLKSAELQDYFRDECVVAQESKQLSRERVAPNVAVLYPIVLADRIELLLNVKGELQHRNVRVEQAQLVESAARLREFVQDPGNARFLPYANRLYRWIVEPVKAELLAAGVDTLVVIPDAFLRAVPLAALHSGEHFLIEEFALAVTPSMRLTAPEATKIVRASALVAGVAQSVQGFAPLPKVAAELAAIHDRVGGKLLANGDYTRANLRSALQAGTFNVVHMATHGVVGATPQDSFLLTYDGKLTMGDLEYLLRINEFRLQPIELLTLSACETAIGDERAALGLAGIAVKSGARSVVASLWLVDDAATAQLMSRFYGRFDLRGGPSANKAQALRAAQLAMLADPATQHPANWAAFQLIGSWQ